jgi:hypothetical protein
VTLFSRYPFGFTWKTFQDLASVGIGSMVSTHLIDAEVIYIAVKAAMS